MGAGHLSAACGMLALGGVSQTCLSHCEDNKEAATRKVAAEPTLAQKCIAEAVGTGIIVTGGCGAVCASIYCASGLGLGAACIAWGSSVALAAYTTRDISGAHLNPAVTASMAVNNNFPKEDILPYWMSQMFGATLAGTINFLMFNAAIVAYEAKHAIVRGTAASTASFAGAFGMVPNAAFVTPLGAFAIEVFATGMLLYLIFAVTDSESTVPSAAGPALVGVTVATIIAFCGPLTMAGLNPARDLGPRLVSYYFGWGSAALTHWWPYTFGPLVGGVLGGALYKMTCAK